MTAFKLTRNQRNDLIQEAHNYRKESGETDPLYIADHLVGIMLSDEQEWGTAPLTPPRSVTTPTGSRSSRPRRTNP